MSPFSDSRYIFPSPLERVPEGRERSERARDRGLFGKIRFGKTVLIDTFLSILNPQFPFLSRFLNFLAHFIRVLRI